jgi:ectoine hydroxylase-related dioxygenase (phytanoyl-CoA dioxygenase family)
LAAPDAFAIRRKMEAFEASSGTKIAKAFRFKTHLIFTWVDALVHNPVILDAMENLLGPDLLCLNTTFFIKEAGDPAFVSWHQDTTYLNLSAPDCITCWVALSASTSEAGCLKVIPGSHLRDQLPHRDKFAPDNMLTRGQEVAVEVNPDEAVELPLAPGEASLHHNRIVHGSAPNRSDDRRIGIAISYIPASVRQAARTKPTAMLVRGRDSYGHFELERRPGADLEPDALERHAAITGRQVHELYAGTGVSQFRR